ncbi:Sec-independent protein translocase protein TatB [Novosphingobium sp.]|uniref:Sec-independent protein translocase protein TatB n=1 Tax=Novosphingobium sp. TaxID=1874826 RepID=UPI0025DEDBCB|nr:Sec-independent protein translocase protein TatB [Novosphingobium sp.]
MFDIGWDEMLLTAIIAIVVIGPKDLPRALRTAGQWIAKIRRVSGHFRSGIETMIREAELDEMEKQWREKNAAIMEQTPPGWDANEADLVGTDPGTSPLMTPLPAPEPTPTGGTASPQLPLDPPKAG